MSNPYPAAHYNPNSQMTDEQIAETAALELLPTTQEHILTIRRQNAVLEDEAQRLGRKLTTQEISSVLKNWIVTA